MTMKTKQELFEAELDGYLVSTKREKGVVLDSLVRQTGMYRESCIRRLRKMQLESVYTPKNKRCWKMYYTSEVDCALKEVWGAANFCCGELLHIVIAEYIAIFKRDKMWIYDDEVTGKLRAMSMATVKRRVTGWVCDSGRKGISTTTPSAIKERVPLFQGSWTDVPVGYGQIDTVAHCGGSLAGDFFFSCGYVDVSSGWIQYTVQWNKGMEVTRESLEHIQLKLPFPLLHVHPDCGTEFLNNIVMSWCEKEHIDVSRSRSYHKNDNGYIEQRNGHIARRWLGYDRLGTQILRQKLIIFCDLICQYHNHFIAQRLCIDKVQLPHGKHRKVYEKNGMTPYHRLLANPAVSEETKQNLKMKHKTLNPKILHGKLVKMKCDILQDNRRLMGELVH